MKDDQRIAVLIDAENVPYANISGILREITRYGTPTVKRIYGDWTKQTASGWKSHLLEHAIIPIQQYSYTSGKNSSDSAMIIDAMDLLYEGNVDSFCIVSSDSDFTRLAVRLREAGKYVMGIGEEKTPTPFIASCDKFVYIENIDKIEKNVQASDEKLNNKMKQQLSSLISASIVDLADENGYVFMGDLGNSIIRKHPDFDPRTYGFHQLTPLIKALGSFDIEERKIPNTNVKHVYIRNK
ncbi:NYN domain-containing protein [Erysipelothrix inopinata]|uniref:NYN domain-containing protein n=1 Tax=Erysipelothrix inopinata TaxID=225084 RepID=A0A7G9RZR8_9FIRM|nr:NYN domain-containing protein [Erysipelothrix inopinata]QNN61093.1 NYN domain-containing protein [Erysipelothrix inopinata]